MESPDPADVAHAAKMIDQFREAVAAARFLALPTMPSDYKSASDALKAVHGPARELGVFVLEVWDAIHAKLAAATSDDSAVFVMAVAVELAKSAGPDWTARNVPFLRELGVPLPALPEDAHLPPHRWTCDCGASHSRGYFPVGTKSHRCLKCGYCGPGGRVGDTPRTEDAHDLVSDVAALNGEAAVGPVGARTLQDILALVSVYVRLVDLETWTDAERELATNWAAACHAHASDNPDVTIPPRPVFVPAPQNDIPAWWFAETDDPEAARRRAKVMGMAVASDERDVVTTTAANIREGASSLYAGVFGADGAVNRPPANPTSLPGEIWIGESRPNSDFPPGDDIPFSKYRLKRWADEWYEWAEKICITNLLPFEPGMGVYTTTQMRDAIARWAAMTDPDADLLQELAELRGANSKLTNERDNAYVERTHLIALVAAFCRQVGLPVGLGQHDHNDAAWDPAWRTIVFVEIPDGLGGSFQASWHIGDRDRELVAYLPAYPKTWDGHTTREKYLRIAATAERLATGTGETVLARWEKARQFLSWLNSKGGQGHKVHHEIDAILGGRS